MYAPEVACAGGSGGGGAPNGTVAAAAVGPEALALVGQRVQPVTVELVRRALEGMQPGQRKRLVEGTGKQLDLWAARARLLPKPAVKALFGPFCPATAAAAAGTSANATSAGGSSSAVEAAGSTNISSSYDLRTSVMIAAVDRIKPLHVLTALVGEERAGAAAAKVCGALLPAPPPESFVGRVGAALSGLRGMFKRPQRA